jgi:Flp pilus assembly pilin Flp
MNYIIKSFISKLIADAKGQDMVEYALIAGFVASVAVAAFPAITATGGRFSTVVSMLDLALSQTAVR